MRALAGLTFFSGAVVAAVVVGAFAGCDGPGAVVTVNIEEGADIDTDEVTGFLVRLGQEEEAIAIDRGQQVEIPFKTAPPGSIEIVVFACQGNAQCSVDGAAFVGCDVVVVNDGDTAVIATVPLFPLVAPEPACSAIINGD